jgi:hypothetical protein
VSYTIVVVGARGSGGGEVVYSADVTISFLNDITTNGSIKIVSDNISPLVWGKNR